VPSRSQPVAPGRAASAAVPWRARLPVTWADGAALLAVLLWGAGFPITKQLLLLVSPLAVTFLRVALTALLFAALLVATRQWRLPTRDDLWALALTGLVGIALNGAFFSNGLNLTTASHAGLIYTLTPLPAFGVSYLLGQLAVRARDLAGLALGVAGAALIVLPPALAGSEGGGGPTAFGDLLMLGAMVTFGLWGVFAAPLLRRYGALWTTCWTMLVGTLGLLPAALQDLLATDWEHLSAFAFEGLLYSGVVAGTIGSLLWYSAVGRIGAARTTVYANLESLFAVLAAALLLGERVEWTALAGGASIVAGVVLTRRPPEE